MCDQTVVMMQRRSSMSVLFVTLSPATPEVPWEGLRPMLPGALHTAQQAGPDPNGLQAHGSSTAPVHVCRWRTQPDDGAERSRTWPHGCRSKNMVLGAPQISSLTNP